MTWEITLLLIVAIVVGGALAAWVMWLIHDSQPIEVDHETEG